MGIIYLSNSVALKSKNHGHLDGKPGEISENVRITLKFDVVDALIPCLLPRDALFRMNAPINFNDHRIEILNRCSMLFRESKSCHILFPFDIVSASGCAQNKSLIHVFAAGEAPLEEELSVEKLTKLHIHLGHAPLSSMVNTLKAPGRKYGAGKNPS